VNQNSKIIIIHYTVFVFVQQCILLGNKLFTHTQTHTLTYTYIMYNNGYKRVHILKKKEKIIIIIKYAIACSSKQLHATKLCPGFKSLAL